MSSEGENVPPRHEGKFPVGTLHNGITLPLIGLGCASGVGKSHVASALRVGYRHLDTAQSYKWGYREDEVGDAVQEWLSIEGSASHTRGREDVFIQTKIHPEDMGYSSTKAAIQISLDRLKVTKIDSVLLHKPRCWEGACSKHPEGTWQDSWRALEEAYDAGLVRAIGICDVDDALLDELLQQRIKPHIIQNWMDPFHQDRFVRQRCKEEGVQYQAYSTLGTQWHHHRGLDENPVMNDATLRSIANEHGVDIAQVVINWATRRGVAVLPASTNPSRQLSNLISFEFDLTNKEMGAIDELDGRAPKPSRPDPNEVKVVFENRGDAPIDSYWVHQSSGEEVHVGEIGGRDEMMMNSYHGHRFVFRDKESAGAAVGEHRVDRAGGKRQHHVIGSMNEDEEL